MALVVLLRGVTVGGHRTFRPAELAKQLADLDVVRCVSVLTRSPKSTPSTPVSFPASGKWLVRIFARERRFILGVYRRQMKAIGYLGEIDRLFGMPEYAERVLEKFGQLTLEPS